MSVQLLRSRRHALTLVLALASLLLISLSGCADSQKPDTAKLDRLLVSYVDALNRRDGARLSTLLGGNHAPADIASRLQRFGGRGLRDVRITHQRESPDVYAVLLSARWGSASQPFEAREIATWQKDRWILTPWPAPLKRPQPQVTPTTATLSLRAHRRIALIDYQK